MFILLLTLLSMYTCLAGGKNDHRIRSETNISNDSIFFFTKENVYGKSGRIISYIHSQLANPQDTSDIGKRDTTYATLHYTPHSFIIRYKDTAIHKVSGSLNNQGYIVRLKSGEMYEYDSAGFRVRTKNRYGIQINEIVNGDIVKSYWIARDTNMNHTTTYAYYPDIDTRDFGWELYGRRNAHLLKSRTENRPNSDPLTVYYTYEYDSQKRITKEIQSTAQRALITSYTYFD